jgi:hypothetical protein
MQVWERMRRWREGGRGWREGGKGGGRERVRNASHLDGIFSSSEQQV